MGAGVTLTRGDLHYVVTEYGIAYLHGKNMRERAMELIRVAHPKFRPWLLREAKARNLVYRDQAYVPGKRGEYPEHLETYRTTKTGQEVLLRAGTDQRRAAAQGLLLRTVRPVDRTSGSSRRGKDMPHERLQEFVVIDYTSEMVILAVMTVDEREVAVGVGQYGIDAQTHTAEVALVVRDDMQKRGVGTELLELPDALGEKGRPLGIHSRGVDREPPDDAALRARGVLDRQETGGRRL